MEHGEQTSHLNLPPQRIRDLIDRLGRVITSADSAMVVLTGSGSRYFLRQIVEGPLPNLTILSHSEIPPGVKVMSLGVIQ